MSLSHAFSISQAGLRTTQAGLGLVAGNVANAQTPGYVRKSLAQATTAAGGVRVASVNRVLDDFVQRQLRVETSGGTYAELRAAFYERLQRVYGEPGSPSSFEAVFNTFSGAVQSLTNSPESAAARSLVLGSAAVLAQSLNGMTADIQALRADAESGLANAVASANNAMQKIAALNTQIAGAPPGDPATAVLKDQRDLYIDELSTLMDIRVVAGASGEYSVFTNSGVQLVGTRAATLSFNPQGTVTPATQWNAEPGASGLGTITLVAANGSIDLIANNAIRSGRIAAYVEMRDRILVEAQNQLDAMAETLAQAFSSENVAGTAVAAGPQSGYALDTAPLVAGNSIHLTYLDNQTGRERRITIVRVDDPAALPLDNALTADPGDEVIGVDFSGGLAAVAAQLNARFHGAVQFDNPTGTVLRVLDDGAGNRSDVVDLSMTRTVTGLAEGGSAFSFFTDASAPYSGAVTSGGPQSLGFAGRIAVNPALIADPSRLVRFGAGIESGDPQRPNFIHHQLTGAAFTFPAGTGFGSPGSPYTGDLATFLRQVLSTQGEAAGNAQSLAQGQAVVVNALRQRVAEESGVNVDQEMANLINLQTAYAANARVMTAVKEMIDILLKL